MPLDAIDYYAPDEVDLPVRYVSYFDGSKGGCGETLLFTNDNIHNESASAVMVRTSRGAGVWLTVADIDHLLPVLENFRAQAVAEGKT